MTRVSLLKDMIRLSMWLVPNTLESYRFYAGQSKLLVHVPRGFFCEPGVLEGIPVHWISHREHCEPRVVIYLHGGGYVIGSNHTHMELACRIAKASRAQVMMLDYRLAPEHPFPAALDDALTAYRYLLGQNILPEQIMFAGDSAGGGLTLSVLQNIRDQDLPIPAGGVCLSPWLDLTCSLSSRSRRLHRDPLITPDRVRLFARHYSAAHDAKHPSISPYFGSLQGLPPVLMQVGGDEILLTECKHFHRRARQSKAPVTLEVWPHMFHVWHFAARVLPEGRQAIRDIGGFVKAHTRLPKQIAA